MTRKVLLAFSASVLALSLAGQWLAQRAGSDT